MTATYDCIATTTLGSNQTSVTFSGISGSYTDLIIVSNFSLVASVNLVMTFNSDTGSNYSETVMNGDGSTASSGRQSNATSIRTGFNTSGRTINRINIMNYSNTTTNKTALVRWDSASTSYTDARVGLWRNTAAITSITLSASSDNIVSGSTFALYGVKAE